MEELISIIVPVYNMEKYLDDCIKSIINQSYGNIEIILVNDASTDSSLEICNQYLKDDIRVRIVNNEDNMGLSTSRNKGLEVARGEYVAFVDADDFLDKNFIACLYYACKYANTDVAQCNYVRVPENSMYVSKDNVETTIIEEDGSFDTYSFEEKEIIYGKLDFTDVINNMSIYTGRDMIKSIYSSMCLVSTLSWTKLYKRSLFDPTSEYKILENGSGIKFPDGRIHEDEAVSYRIFYAVDNVAYIDMSLYKYREVPTSITRGAFTKARLDNLIALEERMQFFIYNNEQALYELTTRRYFGDLLIAIKKSKKYLKNSKQDVKKLKLESKKILKEILTFKQLEGKTKFRTFLIKIKCLAGYCRIIFY